MEHWCSQYVTYRYKAKSALWWPTTGADVDVRFLPHHPGKAFQIELKTTYFGVGYHDVKVDLGQLLELLEQATVIAALLRVPVARLARRTRADCSATRRPANRPRVLAQRISVVVR